MRLLPSGIELPASIGEWVLGHRFRLLLAIVLVTGLAGWQLTRIPYQTALLDAFVDDPTELDAYRERATKFGGDSDDLIFVATEENDVIFTPKSLDAIRAIEKELESFPEVLRVSSVVDAYWARQSDRLSFREVAERAGARRQLARGEFEQVLEQIPLERCWPEAPEEQDYIDLEEVQQALTGNELLAGMLVSEDGRAQIMTVQLISYVDVPRDAQVNLSDRIEAVVRKHGLGTRGVHMAGLLVSQGWMLKEIDNAFKIYFPLGMAIICLTIYALFQRLSVVLITVVVGLTATLWGVGATALVFGKLSVMVAAAPLVILVISTSDVVHLTTAYRLELGRGLSRDDALRTVLREVGGACALTSLTTFVGFMSLGLVPAPSLRHFAVSAAVGVASALLLALTIVPITFSLMKPLPTQEHSRWLSVADNWVLRFVLLCRRISLKHSWAVLLVCGGLMLIGLYGTMNMKVDADWPRRFPRNHPLRTSMRFFNQQLSGTTVVELFLSKTKGSDRDDSLLTPDVIRLIAQFGEQVQQENPEVTDVQSIAMLYRAANEAFGFDAREETKDGYPNTQLLSDTCLTLFRNLDSARIGEIITHDNAETRISVRLSPSGYLHVTRIAEKIDQLAQKTFASNGLAVETTGSYPIVGRIVRDVVQSQITGLVICLAAVSLIMAFGLGSLKTSILAQLPNLLPGVLLLGVLSLIYHTLDTEVLGIPTVALGIAVDDTIHFLHRYRLSLANTGERMAALEQTFTYTGRAILQTTVILCLGMAPFALSSFLSVWMLGTYLVFALAMAVLGDLFLLPALIRVGIIR